MMMMTTTKNMTRAAWLSYQQPAAAAAAAAVSRCGREPACPHSTWSRVTRQNTSRCCRGTCAGQPGVQRAAAASRYLPASGDGQGVSSYITRHMSHITSYTSPETPLAHVGCDQGPRYCNVTLAQTLAVITRENAGCRTSCQRGSQRWDHHHTTLLLFCSPSSRKHHFNKQHTPQHHHTPLQQTTNNTHQNIITHHFHKQHTPPHHHTSL